MSDVFHLSGPGAKGRPSRSWPKSSVFFDRSELNQILSVYSRMVIAGEWCDYGFEGGGDEVAFTIYGRGRRFPAYRVVKHRSARRGQESYRVVDRGGRILKVSHTLAAALKVLDRARLRLT
jgi:hypothetical protein